MICQRTTKAVIYIFTQAGFSADVYLDDFYGAECPSLTDNAFACVIASRFGLVADFSFLLQWCFGYQACRLVLR